MVDATINGAGRPSHLVEHNSDRRGSLYSRLSVLPPDEEGSSGRADIRADAKPATPRPFLRSDAGQSADRAGRADHNGAHAGHGGGLRARDDGKRFNGLRGEAESVPPPQTFDTSQLPDVPDGYWRQALETATHDTISRLRDGDGIFDQPSALEALTEEAMVVTYEQLKDRDPLDANDGRTARIRQQAAKLVLNAQLRVNEHRLKKSQDDTKLATIMARLYDVKKQLELEGM